MTQSLDNGCLQLPAIYDHLFCPNPLRLFRSSTLPFLTPYTGVPFFPPAPSTPSPPSPSSISSSFSIPAGLPVRNPVTLSRTLVLTSAFCCLELTSEKLPIPAIFLLVPSLTPCDPRDEYEPGNQEVNRLDIGHGREMSGLFLPPPPLPRRRRLSMVKVTAIRAMAATLPTTGAAIHALVDVASPASWPAVSGVAWLEDAGVVPALGKKNGGTPTATEDDGVVTASVGAADKSGAGATVDVAEGAGSVAALPPGGVKKMTPLPAPAVEVEVDEGGGTGMVDTPGITPRSAEEDGGGSSEGISAAFTTIAESVRWSAATMFGLVTADLR